MLTVTVRFGGSISVAECHSPYCEREKDAVDVGSEGAASSEASKNLPNERMRQVRRMAAVAATAWYPASAHQDHDGHEHMPITMTTRFGGHISVAEQHFPFECRK